MPNPPLDEVPAGLFDLEASPSLDDVLPVRHERMARVSAYLETVSGNELNQSVRSPNGGMTSIRARFHVVFREEWWHTSTPIAILPFSLIGDRSIPNAFRARRSSGCLLGYIRVSEEGPGVTSRGLPQLHCLNRGYWR